LEKEALAAKLPNQIPDNVKKRRFKILAQAQLKSIRKQNKLQIGRRVAAIVEGFHPDSTLLLRARHQGQCPDIDGQIIINDGRLVKEFGKLYEVEITDVADHDLIGKVVGVLNPHKKNSSKLSLVNT